MWSNHRPSPSCCANRSPADRNHTETSEEGTTGMANNNNDGNEAMEEGADRYNVPALEHGLSVL